MAPVFRRSANPQNHIRTHTFILDGIPIDIQQKPIKSIRLRVYKPDGYICVSAPLFLSLSRIEQQIVAKRDWIIQQHTKFKAQVVTLNIETGELHPFLGKHYELHLQVTNKKPWIEFTDNNIQLHIQANPSFLDKERVLNNWYRQQMMNVLPTLITKWENIIGVNAQQYRIRLMKSRWGSCNTRDKRITLNLNLIKKPLQCLEYVLVHELIHILEPGHNKRFYAFMQQFLPDWKTCQTLLTRPDHAID